MKIRLDSTWAGRFSTAPVLVSLCLLLLNDFYLKATYGNWITGKLSDFAGIFLVAMLGYILWPQRKDVVSLAVIAFFIYWKSALSEPFLMLLNTWGPPGFGRVVDYTDLMALSMVFIAWYVASTGERVPPRNTTLRRVMAVPVVALCLFSMVATSRMSTGIQLGVEQVGGADFPSRKMIAEALAEVGEDYWLERDGNYDAEQSGTWKGRKTAFSYVILSDGNIRVWIYSYKSHVPVKLAGYLKQSIDGLRGEVRYTETSISNVNSLLVDTHMAMNSSSRHSELIEAALSTFDKKIEFPRSESVQTEGGPLKQLRPYCSYLFLDENSVLVKLHAIGVAVPLNASDVLTKTLEDEIPAAEVYPLDGDYDSIVRFVDLRKVDLPE